MQSILISILGKDRPGLIDKLSSIVLSHGGDWIESKMLRLGGMFAGILRVKLPDKNSAAFIQQITTEELGLQIACEQLLPATIVKYKNYHIELVGQNHTGIINKLSHVLAGLEINLEEINTEITDASMSGGQIFKAEIRLQVPIHIDEEHIRFNLEKIADDIMVNINFYDDN